MHYCLVQNSKSFAFVVFTETSSTPVFFVYSYLSSYLSHCLPSSVRVPLVSPLPVSDASLKARITQFAVLKVSNICHIL